MRGKSKATLAMQDAIVAIVEERAPITVRGVAYALFTQGRIDSMETRNTQKVSRVLTAMREEGSLDWTLIVDGSREVARIKAWEDPAHIIKATVKRYRKNYWQDQPFLVEVWAEKSTVHGVLQPVLDKYGVTFRVLKGFGSFTAVRQAAEETSWISDGKRFIAFYLGDHDPSGRYMTDADLPVRLDRYGAKCEFHRIAVTEEDFHRPSFRAASKRKDPRYKWFIERFGDRCWELDAINPNDLRQRVQDHIEAYISWPEWDRAVEVEAAEVESMHSFYAQWRTGAN